MAITEAYMDALQDLKGSDRHKILGLADLAKEHRECATQVVTAVQQHLLTTNYKLPALYVLDAIVKLAGEPYVALFAENLAKMVASLWETADPALKKDIRKLVGTWGPVFPASSVRPLEQLVAQLSPSAASPTTAASPSATAAPGPQPSVPAVRQPSPPLQPPPQKAPAPEVSRSFYSTTIPAQAVPAARPSLSAGPHQLQAQMNRTAALYTASTSAPRGLSAPVSAGLPAQAFPIGVGAPQQLVHPVPSIPSAPQGARPLGGPAVPPLNNFNLAALQQHGVTNYALPPVVAPSAQVLAVTQVAGITPAQGLSPSSYYPDPSAWQSTTQPHAATAYARPQARAASPAAQAAPVAYRGQPSLAAPSQRTAPQATSSQDISLAIRNIAEIVQGSSAPSSSRSAPFDIRSCVLDASKLKECHEGVIDELLSMSTKTRPKHIDWSIIRRRRLKANPVQSRQWFVTTENWLSGTIVTAESATPFFDVEMKTEETATVQEFSEPVDDSQRECAISGERFEEFYDPDTDGWRYKDARRLFGEEAALYNVPDGSIVKVICLSSSPAADPNASAASDQSDRSHLTEEPAALLEAVMADSSPGTKRSAEDFTFQACDVGLQGSTLLPSAKRIRV